VNPFTEQEDKLRLLKSPRLKQCVLRLEEEDLGKVGSKGLFTTY